MKKVLAIGDAHCGHLFGMTPPGYQNPNFAEQGADWENILQIQRSSWAWYGRQLTACGPFDWVVVLGDMIADLKEQRDTSELYVSNRDQQCEMAARTIRQAITEDRTRVVMIYGKTDLDSYNRRIAEMVDAEIQENPNITVEGVTFDIRHSVYTATSPHYRATPLDKERIWAALDDQRRQTPSAQVYIRSGQHYFKRNDEAHWLAVSTPALQAGLSKFKRRRTAGVFDFGFLVFECDDQVFTCTPRIAVQMPVRGGRIETIPS